MLIVVLSLGTLTFLGCAENNVVKDEVVKEISQSEKKYIIVIEKSLKDCKEYGIVLDEKRTSEFMHRSPAKTIEKAAKNKAKTPKKLCQFFEEETSDEKIVNIEAFTSKIMNACEKVGVTLPKEKIHKKITNLPFFVIKKGLAMQNETTVEECELMEKKYK
jgi:hypothetical protein